MSYEIEIGPRAKKFFDKLPKDKAIRVSEKIYKLKYEPFRYLKHLEGDGYKLRIGNYRALIDVNFIKKILVVRVINKRGCVYKR